VNANKKSLIKLLIANRSEVALRIMASAAARGIKTVAIFAPEDALSSYVHKADEAYPLIERGGIAYLNQERIIQIARESGCDALHPGYGFLAENAAFAQRVIETGITWVGPHPEVIELLGSKTRARALAQKANVPIIPGESFDASNQKSAPQARTAAHTIGYPVLIKSADGGGGKAMRVVTNDDDFDTTWKRVVSESKRFFSSSHLIVEKYLEGGRHVEVQLAGDGINVVHLYERECSIQRNRQKVIEEAPCSFISQATRESLYNAACRLAQHVGFSNVGTAEFLVTAEGSFYFLEMNTRLQVEHSVTEQITGIDIVDLQLHLASNLPLPYKQDDITQRGYAIECRVYAEDAVALRPSTGTITTCDIPQHPFARYDHALEQGTEISPLFDPMIAKITTMGSYREAAIAHMLTCLTSTHINGVKTNIPLLKAILLTSDFKNGLYDVHWLEKTLKILQTSNNAEQANELALCIAALIPQASQKKSTTHSSSWRNQQWR